MLWLPTILTALVCAAEPVATPITPFPSPATRVDATRRWTFPRDAEEWTAEHDCRLSVADGLLKVRSTGDDPYFHCPLDCPGGEMVLTIKARAGTAGGGAVYWTTDRSRQRGEDKVASFQPRHDSQWREYQVRFAAVGRLTDLRIDPGCAPGEFDIESIRLEREEPHPLEIARIQVLADRTIATVKNRSAHRVEFNALGRSHTVDVGATVSIERLFLGKRPLESATMEIAVSGYAPIRWPIFVHNSAAQTDWIVRPLPAASAGKDDAIVCRVARDGSLVRIERGGAIVAFLGPLVHYEKKIPALKLVDDGPSLHFKGDGIAVSLSFAAGEIAVSIDSERPCEGPVVRVLGELEQGLFAGLEYLGKGERSSSTLDIESAEHLRFAPDPLKVTMPLMAQVTDRASVAITWTDMTLQPVYAVPNFFDCTDDHRMALRGRRIEAAVRVDRSPLEEQILWAVRKRGLPPVPEPPRSWEQQRELCLTALDGPLKTDAGWGHCIEANWPRQPYADMASTVWRLTGQAPALAQLVPGGAHVPNDCIYFVTGRAQQWLDVKKSQVQGIMSRQQPDGSFRYEGKYRRGHYEDTASGFCAQPATQLLEYARLTGDQAALEAGLRALEYMKRFGEPRGAQTWELSLHTPDQLASAYLAWAYVRGYELTGKKEYLAEARRWAITGVPFVYLWGCRPVMLYATIPVYGATNWQAPNWMGLPVEWVGGVYAYALTLLAPHDRTLDWNHLARGILIAAEQMQYPDGKNAGLLPDSFRLDTQSRNGPNINPCALASLRMVLDGKLDSLCVASDHHHRVAAPFPVVIRDGAAQVQGIGATQYQVLIDGRRVVSVESKGEDVSPLDK
jgi:hypothetical protein